MTYEIYRYIFIGGAVLAGVMLVVTVLLFFLLKIPTVIGDLTGANARKAIENIRSQNESSGEKSHLTSAVNRERGKLTDKMTPSGRLIKNPSHSLRGTAAYTEKISTQKLQTANGSNETTVLGGNETTVLGQGANETTVLGGNETTVLGQGASTMGVTGELARPASETTVLSHETTAHAAPSLGSSFVIEYEITYTHTDEVIA